MLEQLPNHIVSVPLTTPLQTLLQLTVVHHVKDIMTHSSLYQPLLLFFIPGSEDCRIKNKVIIIIIITITIIIIIKCVITQACKSVLFKPKDCV